MIVHDVHEAEREEMFQNMVWVGKCIPIPWSLGVRQDEHYTDDFIEQFMEQLPEDPGAPLYRRLPEIAEICLSLARDEFPDLDIAEEQGAQKIADLLRKRPGFLVRLETFGRIVGASGQIYIQTGNIRWSWVYVEKMGEVPAETIAWIQELEKLWISSHFPVRP